MIRTRTRTVHAPPRRVAPVVALILAFATTILVAACGSGGSSQGVGGETNAPLETMGLESAAPSGY